jgi:hypothetical protein
LGRVKEEDPATRRGANEVQGHGGKLGTRNRLMVARREGQPVVSGRVAHIGGGGEEASVVEAFIAGGESGSWQQAHTSASTADIKAV